MTPETYWIPVNVGRLAIMARPRAGDWLQDEIDGWQTLGIDTVVSLLEPAEVCELQLGEEEGCCKDRGIEFVSFPIRDRDVPKSISATVELVTELATKVRDGSSIAIHCRAGIGRSALVAACVMSELGVNPADTFAMISRSRGVAVPDTAEQEEWLAAFVMRRMP